MSAPSHSPSAPEDLRLREREAEDAPHPPRPGSGSDAAASDGMGTGIDHPSSARATAPSTLRLPSRSDAVAPATIHAWESPSEAPRIGEVAAAGRGGQEQAPPSPLPEVRSASVAPPSVETGQEVHLTLRIPLTGPFKVRKDQLLREFERAYFTRLLERCQGNVARSAREAGLDRKHLYSILHRHGLL